MAYCNPLPELIRMGFDEQTAIAALSSALEIAGHSASKKEFFYGDTSRGFKVVTNSSFGISKIEISQQLWLEVKQTLLEDRKSTVQRKIVHTILFSILPLNGYYRACNWIQLSPVRTKLYGSNPFATKGLEIDLSSKLNRQIPRPFILEVKYKPSTLIWVEAIERHRALDSARRLLGAWIGLPIVKGVEAYNWVMINGVGPQIAMGSISSGIDDYFTNATEFSNVAGFDPISPVPIATYIDEIVPDQEGIRLTDMATLKQAFDKLNTADQLRYLRCCSAIHEAEYYSRHTSQAIVSYVSAVEALLEPTKKCDACGNHTGISAAFKHFVGHYIKPSEQNLPSLEALYAFRSRLAHGAYALPIDEPFMGLEPSGGAMPLIAHWIAKKGAINWLIEKSNGNV
jgi:hypothetical protein